MKIGVVWKIIQESVVLKNDDLSISKMLINPHDSMLFESSHRAFCSSWFRENQLDEICCLDNCPGMI